MQEALHRVKLVVTIPVYNEEASIGQVLAEVLALRGQALRTPPAAQ